MVGALRCTVIALLLTLLCLLLRLMLRWNRPLFGLETLLLRSPPLFGRARPLLSPTLFGRATL